ncbi:MAG: histidine phosphatase family protein [Bacteriovoracia bacterium]
MNTIYLIRHGQDKDNAKGILNGHRNTQLTQKGEEQARTLAKKLKDYDIDILISSPLDRALRTAKIIGDNIEVKVTIDELLIERDFGILTGKHVTDITEYASEVLETDRVTYFLKVEGAEDFSELYERARAFLKKINNLYTDKNIAIVTHGDIGKMIRASFHNWSWEKGLKTPYFDNTEILTLKGEDIIE